MTNVDPQGSAKNGSGHPLRDAAIVIYATLFLLVLAIPQSLTNWLRDMRTTELQEVALRAAEGLQSVSERAGLATAYRRSRNLFIAVSGQQDSLTGSPDQ
jgi:hypothetical protein